MTSRNTVLIPGEIARLAHVRTYPTTGTLELVARSEAPVTEKIYILNDEPRKVASVLNTMLSYHTSHFFVPYGTDNDMTKTLIVREYVGLVLHLGNPISMLRNTSLPHDLEKSGIKLLPKIVPDDKVNNIAVHSHHFVNFVKELGENWTKMQNNTDLILPMIGAIILSGFKPLNTENKSGWLTNRIRAFSGAIGDTEAIEIWNETTPVLEILQTIQHYLSANFTVRKVIFTILFSLAKLDNCNKYVRLCQEIIQLIRGTEMNHFIMIERYLYGTYPELRKIKCLQGLDGLMKHARKQLSDMAPEEVMFCKILKSKDQTAQLGRQQFKLAAIVATTCARMESSSMENYYYDDSERTSELVAYVTEYVTMRLQGLSLQAASGDSMDAMEKSPFYKYTIEDYERDAEERRKRFTVENIQSTPLRPAD